MSDPINYLSNPIDYRVPDLSAFDIWRGGWNAYLYGKQPMAWGGRDGRLEARGYAAAQRLAGKGDPRAVYDAEVAERQALKKNPSSKPRYEWRTEDGHVIRFQLIYDYPDGHFLYWVYLDGVTVDKYESIDVPTGQLARTYYNKHRRQANPSGLEAMVQRQRDAQERFIAFCVERGFTRDEAEKILRVYQKAKVIKIDPIVGQFTVKHGAFLDVEVLRNAADSIEKKKR